MPTKSLPKSSHAPPPPGEGTSAARDGNDGDAGTVAEEAGEKEEPSRIRSTANATADVNGDDGDATRVNGDDGDAGSVAEEAGGKEEPSRKRPAADAATDDNGDDDDAKRVEATVAAAPPSQKRPRNADPAPESGAAASAVQHKADVARLLAANAKLAAALDAESRRANEAADAGGASNENLVELRRLRAANEQLASKYTELATESKRAWDSVAAASKRIEQADKKREKAEWKLKKVERELEKVESEREVEAEAERTGESAKNNVPWRLSASSSTLDPDLHSEHLASLRQYLRAEVCEGDADLALRLVDHLAQNLRHVFASHPDASLRELAAEDRARQRRGEKSNGAEPREGERDDDAPRTSDGAAAVEALVHWENRLATIIDAAAAIVRCDELDADSKASYDRLKKRVQRRKRALEVRPVAPHVANVLNNKRNAALDPLKRDAEKVRGRLMLAQSELERAERAIEAAAEVQGQQTNESPGQNGHFAPAHGVYRPNDPDMAFEFLLRDAETSERARRLCFSLGKTSLERLIATGVHSGRLLLAIYDHREADDVGRELIRRVYRTITGREHHKPARVDGWAALLREEFRGLGGRQENVNHPMLEARITGIQNATKALEKEVRAKLDPTERAWTAFREENAAKVAKERKKREEVQVRQKLLSEFVCENCGGKAASRGSGGNGKGKTPSKSDASSRTRSDERKSPPAEKAGDDDDSPDDLDIDLAQLLSESYRSGSNKSGHEDLTSGNVLPRAALIKCTDEGIVSARQLIRIWECREKNVAGRRRMGKLCGKWRGQESKKIKTVGEWVTKCKEELMRRGRERDQAEEAEEEPSEEESEEEDSEDGSDYEGTSSAPPSTGGRRGSPRKAKATAASVAAKKRKKSPLPAARKRGKGIRGKRGPYRPPATWPASTPASSTTVARTVAAAHAVMTPRGPGTWPPHLTPLVPTGFTGHPAAALAIAQKAHAQQQAEVGDPAAALALARQAQVTQQHAHAQAQAQAHAQAAALARGWGSYVGAPLMARAAAAVTQGGSAGAAKDDGAKEGGTGAQGVVPHLPAQHQRWMLPMYPPAAVAAMAAQQAAMAAAQKAAAQQPAANADGATALKTNEEKNDAASTTNASEEKKDAASGTASGNPEASSSEKASVAEKSAGGKGSATGAPGGIPPPIAQQQQQRWMAQQQQWMMPMYPPATMAAIAAQQAAMVQMAAAQQAVANAQLAASAKASDEKQDKSDASVEKETEDSSMEKAKDNGNENEGDQGSKPSAAPIEDIDEGKGKEGGQDSKPSSAATSTDGKNDVDGKDDSKPATAAIATEVAAASKPPDSLLPSPPDIEPETVPGTPRKPPGDSSSTLDAAAPVDKTIAASGGPGGDENTDAGAEGGDDAESQNASKIAAARPDPPAQPLPLLSNDICFKCGHAKKNHFDANKFGASCAEEKCGKCEKTVGEHVAKGTVMGAFCRLGKL